ncbi:MAG: SH3 domain-containing protein [Chloroflexota bacterium]
MRVLSLCLIFCCLILFSFTLSAQTDTTCPDDFTGYLEPRLIVDEQARVITDNALNLRPEPTTQLSRIGTVPRFSHVTVLSEPQCADGFVWWQIETRDGSQGWVAEGRSANTTIEEDDYYLEPRGELVFIEGEDGEDDRYIETASGFLEPEGCLRPPDDYEQIAIGYATLNERTLFMLDNAQRIYTDNGGSWATFRWLITQGSYNAGGVSASFGTHDGGGAVDIAVRDARNEFVTMRDELIPMLEAMRIAGFAAWVRENDELYDGSIIHIHSIAVGDAEASEIAQQQVSSEFGYLNGFNGLPPEEGDDPIPDRYGDPIICEWMVEMGFDDMRDDDESEEDA